jgi:uncharacterized phage infection (PIP) family protein YhgE
MRRHPTIHTLGFVLGLTFLCAGGDLRADEGPSDSALAKHGLKRVGTVLALEAESEVHTKAEEMRQLSRQLSFAVAQRRSTLSEKEYQDTIKELNAEINQLKNQSNTATQAMNRIPKRYGYPVNSILVQEYQQLNYLRNQLQMEINQRQVFLNQLKSKPFDPKDRVRLDNEVRTRTEDLHQGAQELRKLVDAAHEKYAALEKDPDVKKWLNTPEGSAGVKPKLGPSRAFVLDEKMLERIEKAADEPAAATPKATRKTRRGTRVKHTAKSADTASPF